MVFFARAAALRAPRRARFGRRQSCAAVQAPRDWFSDTLGAPRHICAPMVDQSHLAFRTLVQRYGVDLCYTPMVLAKLAAISGPMGINYIQDNFSTKPGERLIVQLAASDPDLAERAADAVLERAAKLGNDGGVLAFDVNLGCPQMIASRGNYGAYLLERDLERACAVVERLSRSFGDVRCTAKVRLLGDAAASLEATSRLTAAGASLLTVHARTRHQNKQLSGFADWTRIPQVDENVPLVVNGGISCFSDVLRCRAETRAVAVMSSEALLSNPALFVSNLDPRTGAYVTQRQLAKEYLAIARDEATNLGHVRGHVYKMLHGAVNTLKPVEGRRHVRDMLNDAKTLDDFEAVVDAVEEADPEGATEPRDHTDSFDPKMSWYWRHRTVSENGDDLADPEEKASKVRPRARRPQSGTGLS
ncbi:dihydrouridine synthase-domain-containing protein [Pelagophyceae sp. CCMP2097]|nr:dihydrouridine synthase-domain-containing protein [Pelagophyceae sp. CCMP2097]